MNPILFLKQPKICTENWHHQDLYQILKTLDIQELINAVIKDAKDAKFI